MSTAPPGDERVGIAEPTLVLEERRRCFRQARLHVHDGPILVEHADRDRMLQPLEIVHLWLSGRTLQLNTGFAHFGNRFFFWHN